MSNEKMLESEVKFEDLHEILKPLKNRLNIRSINLFLQLLQIKEILLFLKKLKKLGIDNIEFDCRKDYQCQYGEHSSGPHIELLSSGKEKLKQLGLTEAEVDYLAYIGQSTRLEFYVNLNQWIIDKRNINRAISLTLEEYQCHQKDWHEFIRDREGYPNYLAEAIDRYDFLKSLIGNAKIISEVFGD
jgi:hypothetical protein